MNHRGGKWVVGLSASCCHFSGGKKAGDVRVQSSER